MPNRDMWPIICEESLFQTLFELNGTVFGMNRLVLPLMIPAGCERWSLREIH